MNVKTHLALGAVVLASIGACFRGLKSSVNGPTDPNLRSLQTTADPCSYVRPGNTPYPSKWGCVELEGTSCELVTPEYAFFNTITQNLTQTHACLCTAPGAINKPGCFNCGCDEAVAQCADNADCGANAACDGASSSSGGAKCFCVPGFVNTGTDGFACTPERPTTQIPVPGFSVELQYNASSGATDQSTAAAVSGRLETSITATDPDVVSTDLSAFTVTRTNSTRRELQTVTTTTIVTIIITYTAPTCVVVDRGDGNVAFVEGFVTVTTSVTFIQTVTVDLGVEVTETESPPSPLLTPAPVTPAPVPAPNPSPTTPTGRRLLTGDLNEVLKGDLPEAATEQVTGAIIPLYNGRLEERTVHVAARGFPTMLAFSVMEAEAGDIEMLHYTKESVTEKIHEVSGGLANNGVEGFSDFFNQQKFSVQMELWSLATLWLDGGVILDPTYQVMAPLEMWASLGDSHEVATCLSIDEASYTSSFLSAKKGSPVVLGAIKSMLLQKLTFSEAMRSQEKAIRISCKVVNGNSHASIASFANGMLGEATYAKRMGPLLA